jgi:hypothetical protein
MHILLTSDIQQAANKNALVLLCHKATPFPVLFLAAFAKL